MDQGGQAMNIHKEETMHRHSRGRGAWTRLAVALVSTAFLSGILQSQENLGKGRINGTVVDESSAPLEGVLVIAETAGGKTKLEGTSDKKGRFAIAGLGTGLWKVTASLKGYAPASQDMNVSQLSKNPPVAFVLRKLSGVSALSSDAAATKLFDDGNQLLQAEKYPEALKAFEDFLVKYPELYQVHLNIGTCYLKMGELDKAEAEFKGVLDKVQATSGDYKKDPSTSIRALTALGEIAIKKQDFETAQKYFSQGLEVSPQDEIAAYNVGEIFFSNQQIDQAIKYFEMSIQIKKDWSKPYWKLGLVYLNKGDLDKALEYLNKFVEMDPQNPEVPQVKNIIATIEKMKKGS